MVVIVLNTILCFTATKKVWTRMRPHKKMYSPEEINEVHNIILDLSDSKKPRKTTCDTKRMIMVIVLTMTDLCLNNKCLVFATATNILTTDWSSPKNPNMYIYMYV